MDGAGLLNSLGDRRGGLSPIACKEGSSWTGSVQEFCSQEGEVLLEGCF